MEVEKVTKSVSTLAKLRGKGELFLRKYSPEILLGVGLVGSVTSTVLACKATRNLDMVLENTEPDMERIRATHQAQPDVYTEEMLKKDLAQLYVKRGMDLAKLYGPSGSLGILAVVSILASFGILKKRNVGLAAAYKVVSKAFEEYRGRVVEEVGPEKERLIRHGIKQEVIKQKITDADGKSKTVKHTVDNLENANPSAYSKIFDESNPLWKKNADYNLVFLRGIQQWANDRLKARGFLFLNDVYETLGFPYTEAGQTVGWLDGDDAYVDFGIYNHVDESGSPANAFVNGYERSILLDFNVQGMIYHMIEDRG
jgi:hypothetical protein